jgi:hypothetical protein
LGDRAFVEILQFVQIGQHVVRLQLLRRRHAFLPQFRRNVVILAVVRMRAGEHVARITDDVDDENLIAPHVIRQSSNEMRLPPIGVAFGDEKTLIHAEAPILP